MASAEHSGAIFHCIFDTPSPSHHIDQVFPLRGIAILKWDDLQHFSCFFLPVVADDEHRHQ
ncbi:MAG: hypothetical protein RSD46_05520, partial [Oscillospiraceae bacterium]